MQIEPELISPMHGFDQLHTTFSSGFDQHPCMAIEPELVNNHTTDKDGPGQEDEGTLISDDLWGGRMQ